jgi:hypothetical protein
MLNHHYIYHVLLTLSAIVIITYFTGKLGWNARIQEFSKSVIVNLQVKVCEHIYYYDYFLSDFLSPCRTIQLNEKSNLSVLCVFIKDQLGALGLFFHLFTI